MSYAVIASAVIGTVGVLVVVVVAVVRVGLVDTLDTLEVQLVVSSSFSKLLRRHAIMMLSHSSALLRPFVVVDAGNPMT